jgi:hypothetical protein
VASWRIDSHDAYGDTKASEQRIKKQRFDNGTGARIQSIDRECIQKIKNQIESRNGRTIDPLRTASNADRWIEVDGIQKKNDSGLSVCLHGHVVVVCRHKIRLGMRNERKNGSHQRKKGEWEMERMSQENRVEKRRGRRRGKG